MLRLRRMRKGDSVQTLSMKTDKEDTMVQHNILSERPEAQKEAILWAKETQERIKRSDEATKVLKEKLTPIFLANIQKAKAECQ